jgi:hypothetical protein
MAVTGGSNKRKKFHDKDKYYKRKLPMRMAPYETLLQFLTTFS